MKFDFTGKRVLVAGGTRGIGRATVAAFQAAGARVSVNGRSLDSATCRMSKHHTSKVSCPDISATYRATS